VFGKEGSFNPGDGVQTRQISNPEIGGEALMLWEGRRESGKKTDYSKRKH